MPATPTVEVHGDQVTVSTAGTQGPPAAAPYGYTSGRRYVPRQGSVNLGGVIDIAQNVLRASVGDIVEDVTISKLIWGLVSSIANPLDYRLGIWADDDGRPGAIVYNSGLLTIPAPAFTHDEVHTLASPLALTRGRYWFGMVRQSADLENSATATARDAGVDLSLYSGDPLANSAPNYGAQKTGVTGALPDPFGTPTLDNQGSEGSPIIAFEVA